ncbi:ester cyclase [Bacillus suaedaesalsae]|uniref:Ester cyclase n=1 Tax=Bacillus suaedaesalsae TaxID=2810349 RepID=A0ABS2DMD6_9BACI|nr:ester cyclase [Bacillus suaedaesalsae]MBM6619637.1 ester cyclase [Bacillus suaedaesalsae]
MITEHKRIVVEKWFQEYFTKGNVHILDELTTEDFTYHARNGAKSTTEQLKSFMGWYRQTFHDDEWTINDYIEQDFKLVVRYTGWMTYKGGWFNIPSSNQRVKETGMMIFYFEDGKVSDVWCENSDAAILNELGAFEKHTHEVFLQNKEAASIRAEFTNTKNYSSELLVKDRNIISARGCGCISFVLASEQ